MFKIGDFVVKPNTGVCRIEDIVLLSLTGEQKQYYLLLPVSDERAKLYVGTDADRKRLRPVMTKDEAGELIKHIDEIEAVWTPNDKLREKEYKEAFMTNEPESLVGIIKNIYDRRCKRLAQGKKITSTDERYFKQAEKALYYELAFSLSIEVGDVQALIAETVKNE